MDEGQANNTNVTPSSHPMKFWFACPTAHITQRNFLIGSFSKLSFFIGQDNVIDILVPI